MAVARQFVIDTRDKPGLLVAVMREFAGRGRISFEGALGDSGLGEIPGASFEAEPGLNKSDLRGLQDFVVLPLSEETVAAILKIVTEKDHLAYPSGIYHVQVAVAGRHVFGAYDNFHRDCVGASEDFPIDLLDKLLANGVIRSYHTADNPDRTDPS